MRVLLAFDKFRGSLSAEEACDTAAAALSEIHPDWELSQCPLTDGGEGFCTILGKLLEGDTVEIPARDALGRHVRVELCLVRWGRLPAAARLMMEQKGARFIHEDPIAVIEMAAASGLARLPQAERNPWLTSSAGTGDLIRAAAEKGAKGILLGVGGSATNDLGLGALQALGLQLLADDRPPSLPCPALWERIRDLDVSTLVSVPPIFIACDVSNPLLGDEGATACFGPQKGLKLNDVAKLDSEMERMAKLLLRACGKGDGLLTEPGTGAAGGIAFGLMCATNAQRLPGSAFVAACLDLPARIGSADVVLTGEGHFDAGSLKGKGPGLVADLGLKEGKKVHVFAGRLGEGLQNQPGLVYCEISPRSMPLDACMRMARGLLRKAIQETFA